MLPGIGACIGGLVGGGGLPSVSFRGFTNSNADLTTYTFSSVDIGAASERSIVVVGAVGEDSATNFNYSGSLTIGGIAATDIADFNALASNLNMRMSYAVVPSGATADIVFSFTEPITSASIGVWAVYRLNSTVPLDSDSLSTGAPGQVITLDVQANGVAVIFGGNVASATAAFDAALTERYDQFNEHSAAGADDMTAVTETKSYSTEWSVTAADMQRFIGASWR